MTNKEKLNYIKQQFNEYISNIDIPAKMKTFLESTYQQKTDALKNRIDKDLEIHTGYENNAKTRIDELKEFKGQIDQFLK